MNELAPLSLDGGELLKLKISAPALQLKSSILVMATKIFDVKDTPSQQLAVDVQAQIKRTLKMLESCRVEIKKPVLSMSKTIDKAAADYAKELEDQESRIQGMLDIYQRCLDIEAQKVEAARLAEIRKQEEAAFLAQREQARLAMEAEKAKSKKKQAEIAAQQAELAKTAAQAAAAKMQADLAITPTPLTAQGVYSRTEIRWEVLDLLKFANEHPDLVVITPKASLINQRTKEGVPLGSHIRVWEEKKAVVRT